MVNHLKGFTPIVVATCLLLVGCGRSAEHRLVGTWDGKAEFDETTVVKENPATSGNLSRDGFRTEAAKILVKSISIRLHVDADGKATLSEGAGPISDTITGPYKILRSEGDQMTIQIDVKDPQTGIIEPVVRTLTWSDDDHFTMETPEKFKGLSVAQIRFTRLVK